MNPAQPLRFRRTRDIGEVITAALEFVRQNYKSLGKALLAIVGPVVLVMAVLEAFMNISLFTALLSGLYSGSGYRARPDFGSFFAIGGTFLLIYVGAIVIFTLATTVVYSYLVLYMDEGPGHLDVRNVWKETKRNFFRILRTFVVIAIMLMIGFSIVGLLTGMVALFAPAFAIAGVIIIYIGIIYISVTLSMVAVIRVREDVSISESISRSFELIRGNWWRTALVMFIAYVLITAVSFDLMAPQWLLLAGYGATSLSTEPSGITSIIVAVLSLIPALALFLLYPVPLIAIAVQYFNLVEQKEGTGLRERVDEFGAGLQTEGELLV